MANKTIAEVTAVLALDGTEKVPISTGDGHAHTATIGEIRTYCTQESMDWNEIQNKPTFSEVAYSGDYGDLSNAPEVNDATLTITQGGTTVGTFSSNASNNVTIALQEAGTPEQEVVTKSVFNDTLSVAANTVYKYQNPLSSLTISSIPDPEQTTLESIIYFSTDSDDGCSLAFTYRPQMLFGSVGQLMADCHYVITIKDGCVSVSTPEYVEPWTVETLTFLDENSQPITKRFMIANF